MGGERYDVLVVGSGPAGSVAATVLARGGARVALVDKARFPRDKACGDLVGPRGVQVLTDLGIDPPSAVAVGDMVVVGPTGRRVRLPCPPGRTYPGRAIAVPRRSFDTTLREAALAAGARPYAGRADQPVFGDGGLEGFVLADGTPVAADFVIGADGATSRVAEVAGLIDPDQVLWGFAVRGYAAGSVTRPEIHFWEPSTFRALPGYGWVFPGLDGTANVGLGVGVLADRTAGAQATRSFAAFVDHIAHRGGPPIEPRPRLGGWLKIGMVGTVPAHGRLLLVGDAAGLVNPLQGEGISQALRSGRAAAEAVLAAPAVAARRYRRFLAESLSPYLAVTAPAHRMLLARPRAVAALGRVLTAPVVGAALSGGWSIFWNDLLDGAQPGVGRTVASAANLAGRAVTARSETRRWLAQVG
ncbi:MAG: geranylgeranyl reductase family protein [Acidimicrobiales bacterium]